MKSLFLIIGAPGSGKTTDAQLIAQNNENIAHYSTGELLRTEIKNKTKLGFTIEKIINKGEIVPVQIALDAIINAIKNAKEDIILIDGYPRSPEQMYGLESVLQEQDDIVLKSVIEVEVSEQTAKERVLGRARGVDDNLEVFQRRMDVYTQPLNSIQEFYTSKNLLHKISGESDIQSVVKKIQKHITTR